MCCLARVTRYCCCSLYTHVQITPNKFQRQVSCCCTLSTVLLCPTRYVQQWRAAQHTHPVRGLGVHSTHSLVGPYSQTLLTWGRRLTKAEDRMTKTRNWEEGSLSPEYRAGAEQTHQPAACGAINSIFYSDTLPFR